MSGPSTPMLQSLKQAFLLVLPFLWKCRSTRKATGLTLGIVLLNTLAHAATPWLLGYLLKQYQVLPVTPLLGIVALLSLSWYATGAFLPLRNIVFAPVINRAIRDIRMRVTVQLHKTPIQHWKRYGVTEIVTASTRVYQSLRCFMNISFINVIPALMNIAVLATALWRTHPYTWYFTPLLLLVYGYVYFMMRDFIQFHRHSWETTDRVNTVMTDSLSSTKFHRFHLGEEEERLLRHFEKEEKNWSRNNLLRNKIPLVQVTWFTMVRGGLIMHLLYLLRDDTLSWADFIVIERYTALIYKQASSIAGQLQRLCSSVIDLQKVLDLLALPPHTQHAASSLPTLPEIMFTPTTPVLDARNVFFSHTQPTPGGLQALSLKVSRGEKIAILGRSGVGKSTLCHLLTGIYTPQEGEILLGGTPLQQLAPDTVGKYIHFIDQEASLTAGEITHDWDKHEASKIALGKLQERLGHNKDKIIAQLSGGEKQRLLLTRALSHRPELLIMDETFHALDAASAQELLKLLLKTIPTVILVTHQTSLLPYFDQVYHLEEGRLRAAS